MSEPVESDRPRPPYLRRNTRSWWKRTVPWIMIAAVLVVVALLCLFLYIYTLPSDDDGRRRGDPVRVVNS